MLEYHKIAHTAVPYHVEWYTDARDQGQTIEIAYSTRGRRYKRVTDHSGPTLSYYCADVRFYALAGDVSGDRGTIVSLHNRAAHDAMVEDTKRYPRRSDRALVCSSTPLRVYDRIELSKMEWFV